MRDESAVVAGAAAAAAVQCGCAAAAALNHVQFARDGECALVPEQASIFSSFCYNEYINLATHARFTRLQLAANELIQRARSLQLSRPPSLFLC